MLGTTLLGTTLLGTTLLGTALFGAAALLGTTGCQAQAAAPAASSPPALAASGTDVVHPASESSTHTEANW
ncbi:MAG TPA: hypothetical protein VLC09_20465, partial [Polyangiaceae bacterium]|nr:hypothetical protein [Polyangiaceae bacterium]